MTATTTLTRRSLRAAVGILLIGGLLAACGREADPADPTVPGAVVEPEQTGTPEQTTSPPPDETAGATEMTEPAALPDTLPTGLDAPWSIAFVDQTPLISERDSGRILEITEDGTPREVAIIDGVVPGGEGGLLGIAVHEAHLYTYFTAADENRLERFELTGGPGEFGLAESETILDELPAARTHNGGRIAFGPDGMLYVTVGDAEDPPAAQDANTLNGKILRLEPDGAIPEDNPFPNSAAYSYGHRNPQGMAWDSEGTMYASEFGASTWDELNIIEPGGNYGWPHVEGIADQGQFIDPVQQWEPAEASPSGIAIAGDSIYIANLRGQRLIEVPLADLSTSTDHLVGDHGRLRDVVLAPDDSLWVLTNNTDGRGNPGSDDDQIIRFER